MKKIYLLSLAVICSMSMNAQLVETTTSEKWENASWVNLSKISNTYNSNDQLAEALAQNWFGGAWVNIGNVVYTYNANGNISELTNQAWAGGMWLDAMNTTYTYNANDLLISTLTQNTFGGVTNSAQETYSYDVNGNNTEVLNETWQVGAWVTASKIVSVYNTDNLPIEQTTTNYSTSPVSTTKVSITYNGAGEISQSIVQNLESGNWMNTLKTVYNYNSSNQQESHFSYIWENGSWELSTETIATYNADDLLYQTVLQQTNSMGVLENSIRMTLLYNTIGVGIDENLFTSFDAYPNPTSDLIHIDLNEEGLSHIQVSNMEGRRVFSTSSYQAKQTVDLSDFPSGVYTIQVIKDGKINVFQAIRK